MSIQDKIKRAGQFTTSYLNAFFYGHPGTGKTYLVGTAAESGLKVLLLDCESGRMTVRDTDIDVLPCESWKDLQDAYAFLKRGGHGYDVVAIDSLTEVQQKLLDVEAQKGKRPGEMDQGKWGKVIDKTRGMMRAFRDLPMSVIVLCLSKEYQEETGDPKRPGPTRIRPAISGKSLLAHLPGYFDVVGYSVMAHSSRGPSYRIVTTADSERIFAKDRSGTLDIQEPNDFTVIYGKVFGGRSQTPIAAAPPVHDGPPAVDYSAVKLSTEMPTTIDPAMVAPVMDMIEAGHEIIAEAKANSTRAASNVPKTTTQHETYEERHRSEINSHAASGPAMAPRDDKLVSGLIIEIPNKIRAARAQGINAKVILAACNGQQLSKYLIRNLGAETLQQIDVNLSFLLSPLVTKPVFNMPAAVDRLLRLATKGAQYRIEDSAMRAASNWDLSRASAEAMTIDEIDDAKEAIEDLIARAEA